MTTPCYIFDIDGTIADCTNRLHHIQKQPKDWTAFFAGVIHDKPIPHMINLIKLCAAYSAVILVSGRSDECREDTVTWIEGEVYGYEFPLYMRRAGDHRDDDVIKMELLAQLRADGFEPIMVFDDRKRVVDAWRAAGVPCAQVAQGDF